MKTASWLIGFGCCVALVGLCFLPAAFGSHPDSAMLSAGAMLFSAGMVMAAGGFYVKARYLSPGGVPAPKATKKAAKKVCKMCKREAVIQCRPHQMPLCADCLGKHFDFRACCYMPLERPASETKARSQTTGA